MIRKNDHSLQIFLGSLLGDGSLVFGKGKSAVYSEMHSLKQKDYLIWKLKLMCKQFNFINKPYIFDKYDKRTKKIYKTIKIYASDSNLNKYRDIFYKNNKKIIPKNVLYNLNELGLAVWYMDDGTYHYGAYSSSIATNCFSYNDNLSVKRFLKDKYGVNCKICRKSDGYYIFFKRENAEKFLILIKDYIHNSMIYKLGHLDDKNNDKLIRAKQVISKNKKEYHIKNKDRILKYQRKYRKKNKDIISIKSKIYRIRNKGKIVKLRKKYYILNREKVLKRNRLYWDRNKERLNKRRRELNQWKKKKNQITN
ncbi:hypothetical protein CL617_03425 [archaeon]|nr:hypothetical protein [archaeon]|tara:strand:- start:4313 stop:5239 length:927 start_codon:yes stop_codon:yes gene_type:complete